MRPIGARAFCPQPRSSVHRGCGEHEKVGFTLFFEDISQSQVPTHRVPHENYGMTLLHRPGYVAIDLVVVHVPVFDVPSGAT